MGTLSKGDLVPLNNATKFFSGAEKKFLEAAAAGGDLKKMANGLTLIAGGLVQFATFTRLAFDEVKRELTAIEGKLGITSRASAPQSRSDRDVSCRGPQVSAEIGPEAGRGCSQACLLLAAVVAIAKGDLTVLNALQPPVADSPAKDVAGEIVEPALPCCL